MKWSSGIARVLTSAKVTAAVPGTVVAFFAVRSVTSDMSDNARAAVWSTFILAALGLIGLCIKAWENEDVAQKTADGEVRKAQVQAAAPPQPIMQVNAGGTNTQVSSKGDANEALDHSVFDDLYDGLRPPQ